MNRMHIREGKAFSPSDGAITAFFGDGATAFFGAGATAFFGDDGAGFAGEIDGATAFFREDGPGFVGDRVFFCVFFVGDGVFDSSRLFGEIALSADIISAEPTDGSARQI
jgi:hypothetical protein